MASSTIKSTSTDTALVGGLVNQLLGFQASSREAEAAASAQAFSALGYGAEIDSYEQQAVIAEYNAQVETLAGEVKAAQERRDAYKQTSAQAAALAGAGFADSGSAIDQIASSVREAHLTDQLIKVQAGQDTAGYLQEAAAARSQAAAADIARASALNTQLAYSGAAATYKTYEANLTAAMSEYFSQYGLSEEAALSAAVLNGTDVGDALSASIIPDVDPAWAPYSAGASAGNPASFSSRWASSHTQMRSGSARVI